MLGFARSRKLRSSDPADMVQVSAEEIPIPSQTPSPSQPSTPPVSRNFSYPTNVLLDPGPPVEPESCLIGPNTWNQRGVICSFSPDNILRAVTAELEDQHCDPPSTDIIPERHRAGHSRHIQSVYREDQQPADFWSSSGFSYSATSKENLEVRTKQSTTWGVTTLRTQNQSLHSHSFSATGGKKTNVVDSDSGGARFHAHTTNTAVRWKSESTGHHRAVKSLDGSHLLGFRDESPGRPLSSSGGPACKAREGKSFFEDNRRGTYSSKDRAVVVLTPLKNLRRSAILRNSRDLAMEQNHQHDTTLSEELRVGAQAGTKTRKHKECRGGWLSHIKEWLSTSEPSTQALKNYKKEAFKRAGTTPDDPRATAKLHIPTSTLPPEAIKPSGRGLDPEDVLRKEVERKKRLRRSYQTTASSSGASRTSASRHSSLSSLPFKETREEF